jgi:hypothetical protein
VQFDGEKGHGHAEDAVAESREALDALAGDAIVGSDHFVAKKRSGEIMEGNFLPWAENLQGDESRKLRLEKRRLKAATALERGI